MLNKDNDKQLAGKEAVKLVKDGMTIGLGSGSTVNWLLQALGERVQAGLQIKGIPSSRKTERLAKEHGIPLTDLSETTQIDIAIDGADEISPDLTLLKGGGGSLVREKIVDVAANELIIIADGSKVVSQLGEFPLPVEVLPFGWEVTEANIAALDCTPTLRKEKNSPFISDNGNYILDCKFPSIKQPRELHEQLKLIVGVVETGLFCDMTEKVIVVKNGQIEWLTKKDARGNKNE
ncbi:ribose-5-phosphate isomerase RpiA [Lentibacillus sp. Marseille-P4043]|uniref:ribose-5-phosphate isomerase RpiA n=1 Tax=Lentibacillus sp. Marseille-P4043 TaxID=2040293 RepID=UPI000D0B63AD|nr:ribose-5-phosphate isomerase RpiA [Lentibacillus sp. Marseille-P4043]